MHPAVEVKQQQHVQSHPVQSRDATEVQQAQRPAASLDDQILDIMEKYDEAIHGPMQKALPASMDDAACIHKPSKQLSFPDKAISTPAQTAVSKATDIASQQQSPQQRHSRSVPQTAIDSSQARTAKLSPAGRAPSHQQQQSVHMPQKQPQQQHHQQHQQEQQQQHQQKQKQEACAQDDGDFERMMARFDELERQEAALPAGAALLSNCSACAECDCQALLYKAADGDCLRNLHSACSTQLVCFQMTPQLTSAVVLNVL